MDSSLSLFPILVGIWMMYAGVRIMILGLFTLYRATRKKHRV